MSNVVRLGLSQITRDALARQSGRCSFRFAGNVLLGIDRFACYQCVSCGAQFFPAIDRKRHTTAESPRVGATGSGQAADAAPAGLAHRDDDRDVAHLAPVSYCWP